MSARAIRVTREPTGPRVYVAGVRVHHGATGAILVAVGARARYRPAVLLGCLLLAHDWRDFPFRDCDNRH